MSGWACTSYGFVVKYGFQIEDNLRNLLFLLAGSKGRQKEKEGEGVCRGFAGDLTSFHLLSAESKKHSEIYISNRRYSENVQD